MTALARQRTRTERRTHARTALTSRRAKSCPEQRSSALSSAPKAMSFPISRPSFRAAACGSTRRRRHPQARRRQERFSPRRRRPRSRWRPIWPPARGKAAGRPHAVRSGHGAPRGPACVRASITSCARWTAQVPPRLLIEASDGAADGKRNCSAPPHRAVCVWKQSIA